ncbi:hypothetical protein EI94DRAFT_1769734 [Lactarius quietus]|nr:hypothetical protein EI94DRAFT_1769734 [Lactarius quietus]
MPTTRRNFLVEHAKFPFPDMIETGTASSADISEVEVGLLTQEWKAEYAMPDETLVQKLCQVLDDTLGDALVPEDSEEQLLSLFGRRLEFRIVNGQERRDTRWNMNDNEAHLIFFSQPQSSVCKRMIGEGRSKADYLGSLGGSDVILIEAKNPKVMKRMENLQPASKTKLKWKTHQLLEITILLKAAFYLGMRKMEWLFLTCHNLWMVCRLVTNHGKPFLAFSPICSIQDSSEPFRAFLGAILSTHLDLPVEASVLSPSGGDIPEGEDAGISDEEDTGSSPEDDIDDGSGSFADRSSTSTVSSALTVQFQMTTSRQAAEPGLMITSSSPHSPESFQVWVHLHPLPSNKFVLPLHAESRYGKQRLWLTSVIGSGSTGTVWKCRSDKNDGLFAIKVVEFLCRSDVERQRRFCNEFETYLSLEMAYQSRKLCDRITPYCYGAYKGDRTNVLILELCDGTLNSWDELNTSERIQVYGLVRALHQVGIVHADLEPRNIGRVPGGGLRLIDFSESRMHTCMEFLGKSDKQISTRVTRHKCPELQAMRKVLKPLRIHPEVRAVSGHAHSTRNNTTLQGQPAERCA